MRCERGRVLPLTHQLLVGCLGPLLSNDKFDPNKHFSRTKSLSRARLSVLANAGQLPDNFDTDQR